MTQPKTGSKFTPGPWRQSDKGTKVNGKPVSAILTSEHGDFRDKVVASYVWDEADGRLLAAAPEMYELLLMVLDEAEVHPKAMIPLSDIGMKARRIKAAIDGEG